MRRQVKEKALQKTFLSSTRTKEFIAVFGLSLFYLLIRITNLTIIPIYLDEAIYINWARLFSANEGLAYMSMQDGKTPLFMWIASQSFKYFQDPLVAARMISVIAGLGTMLSIWLLTRQLLGKKPAIFFMLFFTVLPFGVLIERLAFVDSLLMFFVSLSLLFLFLSFKVEGSWKRTFTLTSILSFLSGIILGLGFYTKSSARLFFISFILISILWLILKARNLKKGFQILLSLFLFSAIYLQSVDILKVASSRFWTQISEKESFLTYPISYIITHPLNGLYITHGKLLIEYLTYYITPLILIFALIGSLIVFQKKYRNGLIFLGLTLIALFGPFLSARSFASRYVYLAYPTLVVLASIGFIFIQSGEYRGLQPTDEARGKKLNSSVGENQALLIRRNTAGFSPWWLISQNLSKKITIFILISSLLLPVISSFLIIFKPEYAPLAHDDRSYFLCQGLSGHGVNEAVAYIKPILQKQPVTLAVDSGWGTPEAFLMYLDNCPGCKKLSLKKYGRAVNIGDDMRQDALDHPTFIFLSANEFRNTGAYRAKNVKTVLLLQRPPCSLGFSVPVRLLQVLPLPKEDVK